MILNDAGRMVGKWYWEIENLETDDEHPNDDERPEYGIHNKGYGATIGNVMDWFKTMTTNEYIRVMLN